MLEILIWIAVKNKLEIKVNSKYWNEFSNISTNIIIKWSAIYYCLIFVMRWGACHVVRLNTDTNSNVWWKKKQKDDDDDDENENDRDRAFIFTHE